MIKVENLIKSYGKLEVLKGISFTIEQGKVYGFLGQNGAGKTTTMNILTGLIGFNGGSISYNGKDFTENKRQLLQKVGYLPQKPVFYNYMNAYEYLKFIGELNSMPHKQILSRSEELLEAVKLKDAAKRRLGGYSGGMLQRMGLAVAMFHNPEVLYLDEPTSALDPEGRAEILDMIVEHKNNNTTVFLSTHILNDVERVCDEVSIIDNGRILISKDLESLKNDYIEPIYDIEFEFDCAEFEKKLTGIDWVDWVKADGNKLSVHTKKLETAKHEILKVIASFELPVISLALRKSTLEDIFLRMVNDNGNV